MKKIVKERFFSIELKSASNLKNISLANNTHENVLIEGTIGQLQEVTFTDGVVLEVFGDKGSLRINITQNEMNKRKTKSEST